MDYLPIRVSTLRGDLKIEFDAYVKINDKFVLYLRRGDSFEGERLARLKTKKLRKMFIIPNDEQHYLDYLQKNIDAAFDKSSGKSISSRVEIIQGAQQAKAEEVMENPSDEDAYNDAKSSAEKFANFMINETEALSNILHIDNVDQNIAHHGVTVSSLAIALAKRLGINDTKQQQMLTLGCMIHDIGHVNSNLAINRPISKFSLDELKLYYAHPTNGVFKIMDKPFFDHAVRNIIQEHEEYIDGKGFPNKLTEARMDVLSVIASSCNAVDRLITFEGVPKKEVMKKLMIQHMGRHPLQHLQLLGDIMNEIKF